MSFNNKNNNYYNYKNNNNKININNNKININNSIDKYIKKENIINIKNELKIYEIDNSKKTLETNKIISYINNGSKYGKIENNKSYIEFLINQLDENNYLDIYNNYLTNFDYTFFLNSFLEHCKKNELVDFKIIIFEMFEKSHKEYFNSIINNIIDSDSYGETPELINFLHIILKNIFNEKFIEYFIKNKKDVNIKKIMYQKNDEYNKYIFDNKLLLSEKLKNLIE